MSTATESKGEMVKLAPNDGNVIDVGKFTPHCAIAHQLTTFPSTEKAVIERSMLIYNMIEDLGDAALDTPIPIPNVSPPTHLVF